MTYSYQRTRYTKNLYHCEELPNDNQIMSHFRTVILRGYLKW